MSSIEDFPSEVLEQIFLHLPILFVLEEVMLVCAKFHDVVASSAALMKSVVLTWHDRADCDKKKFLNSPRKYFNCRLTQSFGVTTDFADFLSNHSSTITSIHLQDCEFEHEDLHFLLTAVAGTLERLIYMETAILGALELSMKVELPRLHTLQVSRADEDQTAALSLMSMISTKSLHRFIYSGVGIMDQDQKEMQVLDALLRSQTNLMELELPPLHSKPFIRHFLEYPFTLPLKKLLLELYHPTVITRDKRFFHDENLAKFFEMQQSTLKDLSLGNCVLDSRDLKLILALNLQNVEFGPCKFILEGDWAATNLSIKTFTLYQHGKRDAEDELAVCSFIKSCKSLETIAFFYGAVTMDLSLIISEDLVHLKKLQLRNCSIVSIPYPRVEEVEVYRCKRDEIAQLVLMNPQLRRIRAQQELREDEIFTRILQRVPQIKVVAHNSF